MDPSFERWLFLMVALSPHSCLLTLASNFVLRCLLVFVRGSPSVQRLRFLIAACTLYKGKPPQKHIHTSPNPTHEPTRPRPRITRCISLLPYTWGTRTHSGLTHARALHAIFACPHNTYQVADLTPQWDRTLCNRWDDFQGGNTLVMPYKHFSPISPQFFGDARRLDYPPQDSHTGRYTSQYT